MKSVYKDTCHNLRLTVDSIIDLEYYGQKQWDIYIDSVTSFSTNVEVKVPLNDTSGFIIKTNCNIFPHKWDRYFITYRDTVYSMWGDPSQYYIDGASSPLPLPTEEENRMNRLKDYERAKREWEEKQKQLKTAHKSVRGHLPGWSAEEAEKRRYKSNTITLDSLHKLEEMPLTELSGQFVQVGETLYVRHKGEYKFKPAEMYSSREEMEQSRRNREPDLTQEKHITIDLRKQDDYDFLKQLVDSLIPMEKKGYYHTVTTFRIIDKIKKRNIEYAPYPRFPGEITPPGPSKAKPPRHKKQSNSFNNEQGRVAHRVR